MTGPILHVVGARPNFMKAAPVWRAVAARRLPQMLVHTGQHYDASMSDVFFGQLGLPEPDVNLEVGSASHAAQTARIMTALEPVLLERRPVMVMVYGDVNSTVAAALVAVKLGISVAHVEAGLRSRDRTMPEEINRIVTDRVADVLYTPSSDADENLAAEGVESARVKLVGNVMIDTLRRLLPAANARWRDTWAARCASPFALVTLHRPSNVDEPATLERIVNALADISRSVPLLFAVHPRTRERLASLDGRIDRRRVEFLEPLGYLDFLALQQNARLVITDSGGIQEESTVLGVPCITLRENTERPVTITMGTNVLVGRDMTRLCEEVQRVLRGERRPASVPPLWDGRASERIADHLVSIV